MARKYTAVVVPETHWDRAWYSTFQQFRMRLVKLADKLIQILNDDPRYESFTFDGQTIVLEDYLEIRPEMEHELKRLIQEDRIFVGPWYILPDEFLVSPEAIVRNLMIGHMIAEKFGKVMKVGYIPDPFGHISQLPQILQGFGIDSAIFMRGMGDEGESLGSEFLWYAPDGKTSVLAVHQIGGYCNAVNLGYVQGELDLDNAVERCRDLVDMMKPYARTSNLLFNNGCDHIEPQPELADIIEYVNDRLDNVELVHGTFADYLDRVKAESPKLKKYQGELRSGRYQILLSGVFSTRMYMRQANEAAQTLMERWAEPFSALNWLESPLANGDRGLSGSAYPRAFLWYAWKELIKNHPHDDICGCSVDEVHRDDMTRYAWVRQVSEELTREALQSLAGKVDTKFISPSVDESIDQLTNRPIFVVFNPLPWPRSDSVCIELPTSSIPADFVVRNAASGIVPAQITRKGDGTRGTGGSPRSSRGMGDFPRSSRGMGDFPHAEITFLARVPALGYTTYLVDSGEATFGTGKIRPRTMENKFFRIKINTNGSLDILDKSTGAEYKGCNVYEDTEDAGDEYDYSPIKRSRTITSRRAKANVKIIENGPVKTTAEIRLSMNLPKGLKKDRTGRTSATLSCPIITEVTIYADIPRIDFATTFENKVEDHRLRVLFPTGIKTDAVHVEGHFDVLTRSVGLPKPKADWAQAPLPTNHQNAFVDIDDGQRGLAVINKGLPEYEVRRTSGRGCIIYLTLLRCVGWLSRGDLLTRRGNAGPSRPAPEAQCIGTHTFLYSVFPHSGDWVSAQVQRRAHEHNVPMRVVRTGRHDGHLPSMQSFVSVEPHNLMVTALKKCELGDGLILRFFNSTEETVNGIVKTYRHIKTACLTNLNEQPLANGGLGVREDGAVSLEVGGREIKTIKLVFSDHSETTGHNSC
jgi:mannosylglycerate hydrolase